MDWILTSVQAVVFSGGAVKGHAFIGALEVIEEVWQSVGRGRSFTQHVSRWGGVSIGALVALGCALGLSPATLSRWFCKQDTVTVLVAGLESLASAYASCGLMSVRVLEERVVELLQLKWPAHDSATLQGLSFAELHALTGKELSVGVANLSLGRPERWSCRSTPNTSVATAVAVSMSAPFLFQPTKIDQHWYADGGLYSNFPIDWYPAHEVLGIRVNESTAAGPESDLAGYLSCILVRAMEVREEELARLLPAAYQSRILRLFVPPLTSPLQMFLTDPTVVSTCHRHGRLCCLLFLCRDTLPVLAACLLGWGLTSLV